MKKIALAAAGLCFGSCILESNPVLTPVSQREARVQKEFPELCPTPLATSHSVVSNSAFVACVYGDTAQHAVQARKCSSISAVNSSFSSAGLENGYYRIRSYACDSLGVLREDPETAVIVIR